MKFPEVPLLTVYTNGDTYEGLFNAGKCEGCYGIFKSFDDELYKSQIIDDRKNGNGVFKL